MAITLDGRQCRRFAADLLAHRGRFSVNDADYAEGILKVSLNTYKKCVQANGEAVLALKRNTFVSIFTNAQLDPKNYDLSVTLPARSSQYGGYDKNEYAFICGRYFLYRRSFLTARNITRSVLDIEVDPARECLSFREVLSYTSDADVPYEQEYAGDIHIDRDRTVLALPAFLDGQVRLTMVSMPQRPAGREKMKMRGALLTQGFPKGYWQPTVSCVIIESAPPEARQARPGDLGRTIQCGTAEHEAISAELAHAEEHAAIITPLMWHRSHAGPGR